MLCVTYCTIDILLRVDIAFRVEFMARKVPSQAGNEQQ